MSADTYLAPEHGWTCFHCGETFHVEAQARGHFGSDVAGEPMCVMRANAFARFPRNEWPLMYRLRDLEAEVLKLRAENEQLDYEAGLAASMANELERLFGKDVRTAHQAWLKLEAMEGRALAAEERLAAERKARADDQREFQREARDIAAEARWAERQGDEYGSY